MLPSAAPTVLMFARTRGDAQTWAFVVGYLLAWTGYGLVAYAVYRGDPRRGAVVPRLGPARARGSPAARWPRAGLYQLTPLKSACLRHCRSPLHFLLRGRPRRARRAAAWASSTAASASAAASA